MCRASLRHHSRAQCSGQKLNACTSAMGCSLLSPGPPEIHRSALARVAWVACLGFPPLGEKEQAVVRAGGPSLVLGCDVGTHLGVRRGKTSGCCSAKGRHKARLRVSAWTLSAEGDGALIIHSAASVHRKLWASVMLNFFFFAVIQVNFTLPD